MNPSSSDSDKEDEKESDLDKLMRELAEEE
jgi:hypothetical protein